MRILDNWGRPGARQSRASMIGLVLLLSIGRGNDARGDDQPPVARDVIELKRCQVDFARASFLGAPIQGVLKECSVHVGDRVTEGQIIGRLKDDDVVAELMLRNVTGESSLNIELAEARKLLADTKLLRAIGISKRGYLSDADLKTAECEALLARLDVETAKQQLQIAKFQVQQAKAMIRFREFVTPHEGVVSEIYRTPGEGIVPINPVFRIVDDHRMRIVGQLDVVDIWRVRVGQPVRVWPTIPGVHLPVEQEMFEGRVIQLDGQIDPLTHTCRVVAEVENRSNLLRAGLEARMEIDPGAETPPAPEPRKAAEVRDDAARPTEPKPANKTEK